MTEQDILYIHHRLIEDYGGVHGIQSEHRLKSAINKLSIYKNPIEAAAYFVRDVVQYHPFTDGNKRTAVTVMSLFLQSKLLTLLYTPTQLETFALDVASKKLTIEQTVIWLKNHTR